MKIFISCPFGLSAVLNKELKILGYTPAQVLDTGSYIEGDMEAIYRINLRSRVANKVYLVLEEGKAETFDQLFDITSKTDRHLFVPKFSHISVFAKTKNSKLDSEKTIQSITQKAIYNKILPPNVQRITKEDAPATDIQVMIEKDIAKIMLNTSGDGLYKRAYRTETGEAPIKENLGAGLILLAGWRFKESLLDPFCGSGTIAIEAAMIAKNIAPGLKRTFAFQYFKEYKKSTRDKLTADAKSKIYPGNYQIFASDNDPKAIEIAEHNAYNAGVQHSITFQTTAFQKSIKEQNPERIITNPPYGKRLQPDDLHEIYTGLVSSIKEQNIKGGFISFYPELEKMIDDADRKTNTLYNGREKSQFRKSPYGRTQPTTI